MGKLEIRPLATPKPLNRSSQKVAHVITSLISTHMQNLVTIPPGISFPRMHEIVNQNVYSASFGGSSNAPQPKPPNRFSRVIRQTTRFRARMCLFGFEDKNLTFTPRNSRKNAVFGSDFDGTKFSTTCILRSLSFLGPFFFEWSAWTWQWPQTAAHRQHKSHL